LLSLSLEPPIEFPVDDTVIQIQDIVSRHLQPLQLLPDTLLAGAVQMFVEKNDADAIDEVRFQCNHKCFALGRFVLFHTFLLV